jgi:hypothetical protein
MSDAGPLAEAVAEQARACWLASMRAACDAAEKLADLEVHKQFANRLLEPFAWHTVLVTATEWDNFFALRCHPDAQPEMQAVANAMREAMEASDPMPLEPGEWHLPYVGADERFSLASKYRDDMKLVAVSVGRCARVSTLTQDGKRDPDADIALAARLSAAGHLSPFEHVACVPDTGFERDGRGAVAFVGNFRGWVQRRKQLPFEWDFSRAQSWALGAKSGGNAS